MKKNILKLVLACLAFATMSGVALAQVNQLGDPGFEQELGQKLTNFANFNAAGFWLDDGVNYTNTGFEGTGAHGGVERAYEMSGDDGAFQISGHQMANGELVSLTWWGLATSDPSTGNTNPPEQVVGLISCPSSSPVSGPAGFATCSPLTVTSNGLTGAWVQYTLNYTAQPGDVGKFVGCYFNTTNAFGFVTSSFGGYDDFYLAVLPAGSKPSITVEPASQTAYSGASVSFSVSAVGATGYQWMGGKTGSGIYTNLLNAGQFSGVTTTTLTITNVQPTNSGDYIVIVSNGNGSVTSAPPANLTVASIIYQENFNVPTTPDQSINNVGWRNDVQGAATRIFTGNGGVVFPNNAVYSYVGNATNEAFYATTATANGGPYNGGTVTNKMAFPGINLASVQNLTFAVDLFSQYNGTSTHTYFAVQMNSGSWYVSTSELLPQPVSTAPATYTLKFNNAVSAWNQLTVNGNGADNTVYPILSGTPAASSLSGYITGVGLVCVHSGGSTMDFDNFTVAGAIPPSPLPVFSALPIPTTNFTGTTAAFSAAANSNGVASAVTYQWVSRPVSGGTFVNLSNGGQYSGVTSSTLVISNVTSIANHLEYAVYATDAAGPVLSALQPGAVPAILTVTDSSPLLVNGASVYPNNANQYPSGSYSLHAGNNNIMNLTASFVGDLPIAYQWQFSPTNDGTGLVNILNATNSTYTLSNPQTNNTGYFRLQASNSQGGPTNSAWVQLTVLPAATSLYTWSAPVAIGSSGHSTVAQILGTLPGTYIEAESFNAPSVVSVTNGATVYVFDNTGVSASTSINEGTKTAAYTGPSTGDPNLDTVLGTDLENSGGATITLNNLLVGTNYSIQLIALNDTAGSDRQVNFSDTNDTADVSSTFAMGDNVYLVGTFTANATSMTLQQNELNGHGYLSAVIVRQVPLTPTLSIQKSGANVVVNYANGRLLQSTSLNGPWITNSTPTPYTFTPAGPVLFFRVQQ